MSRSSSLIFISDAELEDSYEQSPCHGWYIYAPCFANFGTNALSVL